MPYNARFLYQQPKTEINNYLIVNWFSLPLQTVEKHLVSTFGTQILSSSEEIFTGSFRIRRIVQDRNKKSAYLWLWTERNAALHD